MRIFVVAGKGSNGKNTVSEMIKDYYAHKNEKTVIIGFADYIKLIAMKLSDWDGKEESKPRKLLQDIGQEIRDEISEDFFTKRIKEDIAYYEKKVDNIVISDARLPFEIEYIKNCFDKVISINVIREGFESNLNDEEKNHITEVALNDYKEFDYVILNSSLQELKIKVDEILEELEDK